MLSTTELARIFVCSSAPAGANCSPASHLNCAAASSNSTIVDHDSCDTVGAVAVDACGNFAYATSTGGITAKVTGRVGDSPIIGGYRISSSAAAVTR